MTKININVNYFNECSQITILTMYSISVYCDSDKKI
jgi:hypothetical protein